jgi:hypothetical protein
MNYYNTNVESKMESHRRHYSPQMNALGAFSPIPFVKKGYGVCKENIV